MPHNLVSLCRKCHMAIHHEIPATEEWHEETEYRIVEYISDCYVEDDDYWRDVERYNRNYR